MQRLRQIVEGVGMWAERQEPLEWITRFRKAKQRDRQLFEVEQLAEAAKREADFYRWYAQRRASPR